MRCCGGGVAARCPPAGQLPRPRLHTATHGNSAPQHSLQQCDALPFCNTHFSEFQGSEVVLQPHLGSLQEDHVLIKKGVLRKFGPSHVEEFLESWANMLRVYRILQVRHEIAARKQRKHAHLLWQDRRRPGMTQPLTQR